jgi:hypothetical protein
MPVSGRIGLSSFSNVIPACERVKDEAGAGRIGSPPHHAEGVSSTRRGEGSGVGGTLADSVVGSIVLAPLGLSLASSPHP